MKHAESDLKPNRFADWDVFLGRLWQRIGAVLLALLAATIGISVVCSPFFFPDSLLPVGFCGALLLLARAVWKRGDRITDLMQ